MYNTYAVTGTQQPVTTTTYSTHPISNYSTVSYPVGSTILRNEEKTSPQNTTICSDTIKTDFGKIKAVEVLYFRAAQLERTIDGQSKFASVGPLQVLYFPQYDRFVLSLNSWKYPLLKRIPVVASSASHGLPVTYTLPTVGGFFSLVIPKVDKLEALYNLESILEDNSKLTFSDSDEVLSHSQNMFGGNNMILGNTGIQQTQSHYVQVPQNFNYNGNMMQGSYSPHYGYGQSEQGLTHSFQNMSVSGNQSVSTVPKKQSRWKRIFGGPEYAKDKGSRIGSSRHNLNMIQKRDLSSIKMTTEVMAASIYYPKKEVERWIIYNKEMANIMNFSPELAEQDFDALGHSSLNRSNIEVDPNLPCMQPITSDRPTSTYEIGRNFTNSVRHDGKRTEGITSGHSHSIDPNVSGRFNNLSTSQFEGDRFKNMTNTDPLYEATGISPISKIEQPYSFIQDDILADTKPSVTERIQESVTTTNETRHLSSLRQQEPQMSFGTIPNTNVAQTTTSQRPGIVQRIEDKLNTYEKTAQPYDLTQAHYAA